MDYIYSLLTGTYWSTCRSRSRSQRWFQDYSFHWSWLILWERRPCGTTFVHVCYICSLDLLSSLSVLRVMYLRIWFSRLLFYSVAWCTRFICELFILFYYFKEEKDLSDLVVCANETEIKSDSLMMWRWNVRGGSNVSLYCNISPLNIKITTLITLWNL